MIPQKLQNLLESLDFEEDGIITLLNCSFDFGNATMVFRFFDSFEDSEEHWKVVVGNRKSHEIFGTDCHQFRLLSEHCLLSEFNEGLGEMYLNQRKDKSSNLLHDLYSKHRSIFRNWVPFDRFINHGFDNLDKFQLDFGLFARGPLSALEAYARVLEGYYSKVNIIGNSRGLVKNKDGSWTKDDSIYKVLLLGSSYIVGETFDFERIK